MSLVNKLKDLTLKNYICALVWVVGLPIRALIATAFPFILPAGFVIWGLLDCHAWACKDRYMPRWSDWACLALPKAFLWDFFICGRINL